MQLWLAIVFAIDADYDYTDDLMGPLLVFVILGAVASFVYRRWWRLRRLAARWPLTGARRPERGSACNPAQPGHGPVCGRGCGPRRCQQPVECQLSNTHTRWRANPIPATLASGGPYNSREDASAAARPWLLRKVPVRYNPARPYRVGLLARRRQPLRACAAWAINLPLLTT